MDTDTRRSAQIDMGNKHHFSFSYKVSSPASKISATICIQLRPVFSHSKSSLSPLFWLTVEEFQAKAYSLLCGYLTNSSKEELS